MNLAKEVILAGKKFKRNYKGASVCQQGLTVMDGGKIKDNAWYVHKMECFLMNIISDKKKNERKKLAFPPYNFRKKIEKLLKMYPYLRKDS